MRSRLFTLTLVVLVVTGLTHGAQASEVSNRDFEEMAVGLESLFTELLGASDVRITFKNQGNGLYSLSIPLEDLEGYEQSQVPPKAKALRPMATGHQVSEPTDFDILIHAVLATLDIDYNIWLASINLNETETRETTITHKGPGPDFKFKQNVEYDGSSLNLFWVFAESLHEQVGEYFLKSKIAKGGSKKIDCFAQ
ncbi:MAG: hypothetical protein OES47_12565 [Acidobacteriota bacterium]|nr:hypothetical protein [Acidobacteriota bacterium]